MASSEKSFYSSKKKKSDNKKKPRKSSTSKKITYTYILKDLNKNIYKIGKTTSPTARFRSLCIRGRVVPISLIKRDIETELHKEFAANRVTNNDFIKNGATEWFKKGGKFNKLLKIVDTGKHLPFITVSKAVKTLFDDNKIEISSNILNWSLKQCTYADYTIGLNFLYMLGYITIKNNITCNDPDNVLVIGRKVSISENLMSDLENRYTFYIGNSLKKGVIPENRKKQSYLRSITIENKNFDLECFLMINSV